MALNAQKILEVLSGLTKPGETVLAGVEAKWVGSGAFKAAAFLLGPAGGAAASQGQQCLLGLTERHIMVVGWSGLSNVIKPRKATHIALSDIANIGVEPKRDALKIIILRNNGKKDRYAIAGLEWAQQFVQRIEQVRQMGGAAAQPMYAAPPPAQPAYTPPPQQPYPPQQPPYTPPSYTPPPQQTYVPPAAPSPMSVPMMACAQCHQQIEADSRFCENCGTPVGPQRAPSVCSHCGAQVKPAARFCGSCGTRL